MKGNRFGNDTNDEEDKEERVVNVVIGHDQDILSSQNSKLRLLDNDDGDGDGDDYTNDEGGENQIRANGGNHDIELESRRRDEDVDAKNNQEEKDNAGDDDDEEEKAVSYLQRLKEVFWYFLPMGYISFGGPHAHIGILHRAFVEKRKWLSDEQFSELFALGQSIPGPTSTQMVIAIGNIRGGFLGGLIAYILFNVPSALLLFGLGFGLSYLDYKNRATWIKGIETGLACCAVSLIASAAWKLIQKVANSRLNASIMYFSCAVTLVFSPIWLIPIMIFGFGFFTLIYLFLSERLEIFLKSRGLQPFTDSDGIKSAVKKIIQLIKMLRSGDSSQHVSLSEQEIQKEEKEKNEKKKKEEKMNQLLSYMNIHPIVGVIILVVFFAILIACMSLRYLNVIAWEGFIWFETFFRIGALIFGGGQVVIPMLFLECVDSGWIEENFFLNGIALGSSLPGPMFNFSAYIGAIMGGPLGSLICWLGLFLPGYMFIIAVLPFWKRFRSNPVVRRMLVGMNASAIGLVLTAVYILWHRAVKDSPYSAIIVLLTFGLIIIWDISVVFVVAFSALAGYIMHFVDPQYNVVN